MEEDRSSEESKTTSEAIAESFRYAKVAKDSALEQFWSWHASLSITKKSIFYVLSVVLSGIIGNFIYDTMIVSVQLADFTIGPIFPEEFPLGLQTHEMVWILLISYALVSLGELGNVSRSEIRPLVERVERLEEEVGIDNHPDEKEK